MGPRNPSVDGYIRKQKKWSEALEALRTIVMAHDLVEDIKWRTPTYTLGDANVVMFGAFNENCTISFLKGVLLKDEAKILELPGAASRSVRVVRIRDAAHVAAIEKTLHAYVDEAVALERSGAKVELRHDDFELPEELTAALAKSAKLKKAWDTLTPGRRRGYVLHFGSAKQAKTRVARIEKATPKILAGKGLDDD